MLVIDHNKKIYEQLYEQIKKQILSGKLKPGTRLQATRGLAQEYGISRNSVVAAYEQLLVEGYVRTVIGSGYYVEKIEIPYQPDKKPNSNTFETSKKNVEPKYNFRYGNLEYNCYQNRKWRKCLMNSMNTLSMNSSINYLLSNGSECLRRNVADFLLSSRAVKCNPEQIVITNGHQAAIDIICTLFDDMKYEFAIEDPGYDGCRVVFERHGFNPQPIIVEYNGISIDELQNKKHQIVYVTPSHQFPTGCILPIGKRLGIIDWAKRTDSYIIEDDYDSELRYNSHPIQSLQSLDGGNRVIYLGTFSKSLSPDLRIAYLVLPEKLLSTYKEKYKVSNSNVPTLIQEALAEYIESGEYENGLRAIRTFYKRKHDYILEHLKRDDIELLGTEAGLHFLMNINTNLNRTQIMQIMEKYGIGIYSTERYWILHEKCDENQILVGFSSIPSIDLEKAMISFNNALDEITR